MNENYLITSRISRKAKKLFLCFIYCFLILAAFSFIIRVFDGIASYTKAKHSSFYYPSLFFFIAEEDTISFWTFIGSLFIAIVLFFIYRSCLKCYLTVTDKNVIGRTIWGKKINLPVYQISSFSTRPLFSKIIVSTSSGNTSFAFIENYESIGKVISDLINSRQEQTTLKETHQTEQKFSNQLDDIIKLKEMLDSGIITQEEFDAKKKQLLGL